MICKAFGRVPADCPQAYPHLAGTTPARLNRVWAFLDHAPQGIDMKQDFPPALILSSSLSTEGGDKSTHGRVSSSRRSQRRRKPGITPPEIVHKDDCAFIDRASQVLGETGIFGSAPRLSSPFSTVGGDKCPARRARHRSAIFMTKPTIGRLGLVGLNHECDDHDQNQEGGLRQRYAGPGFSSV